MKTTRRRQKLKRKLILRLGGAILEIKLIALSLEKGFETHTAVDRLKAVDKELYDIRERL